MVEIAMKGGHVTKVDDEDARFAFLRWHATPGRHTAYAQRKAITEDGRRVTVFLHREIMRPGPGEEVDHINGDGLDNRRSNLRRVTTAQNAGNQRASRSNSSGFKGVSWSTSSGAWRAQIQVARRSKHLGYFASKEEAARAYDAAALKRFGEFARLNFPAPAAIVATPENAGEGYTPGPAGAVDGAPRVACPTP